MTSQENIQLRARSLGEILDQAIRLYRNNFITFVGIIGVMQVPLALIQIVVSYFTIGTTYKDLLGTATPEEFLPQMVTGGIGGIIVGIASIVCIHGIAISALTRAIADSYLGEKTGIVDAYKKIGKSWISIIGGMFYIVLFIIIALVWMVVPIVGWVTGPGILVFTVMVVLAFIAPCVVLEKLGAWKAFSRAWKLGMKRFWWIFGFMAILYTLNYVVVSAPTTLISLLTQFTMYDSGIAGSFFSWRMIVQYLVSLVLSLVYMPLQLTGVVLAYFDLRVRYEGFDLAVMAHRVENEDAKAEELTTLSLENAQKEKLFSIKNFGNFAAFTVTGGYAFLALLGLIIAIAEV